MRVGWAGPLCVLRNSFSLVLLLVFCIYPGTLNFGYSFEKLGGALARVQIFLSPFLGGMPCRC